MLRNLTSVTPLLIPVFLAGCSNLPVRKGSSQSPSISPRSNGPERTNQGNIFRSAELTQGCPAPLKPASVVYKNYNGQTIIDAQAGQIPGTNKSYMTALHVIPSPGNSKTLIGFDRDSNLNNGYQQFAPNNYRVVHIKDQKGKPLIDLALTVHQDEVYQVKSWLNQQINDTKTVNSTNDYLRTLTHSQKPSYLTAESMARNTDRKVQFSNERERSSYVGFPGTRQDFSEYISGEEESRKVGFFATAANAPSSQPIAGFSGTPGQLSLSGQCAYTVLNGGLLPATQGGAMFRPPGTKKNTTKKDANWLKQEQVSAETSGGVKLSNTNQPIAFTLLTRSAAEQLLRELQ